jgi:hypothetical protein
VDYNWRGSKFLQCRIRDENRHFFVPGHHFDLRNQNPSRLLSGQALELCAEVGDGMKG